MDKGVFAVDFDHPAKATDLTLLPTDGSRRGWGLVLEGPNALERFPLSCEPSAGGSACLSGRASESCCGAWAPGSTSIRKRPRNLLTFIRIKP